MRNDSYVDLYQEYIDICDSINYISGSVEINPEDNLPEIENLEEVEKLMRDIFKEIKN